MKKNVLELHEHLSETAMQIVLEKCGFSKEMITFSITYETISPYTLVDIVCRAAISLDEKRLLLCDLFKDFKGNSIRDYTLEMIKEIDDAKMGLEPGKTNDREKILYMFSEWYDTDDVMHKSSGCGMFANLKLAEMYIKNEEIDNDTGEGYYRIESWDPHDRCWEMPRYDYYWYNGAVCWFEKKVPKDYGNIYYSPENRQFSSGDRDLSIMTPYKTGDIVLIDCRPFAPPFHAMIMEAFDQFDCCFPNIVFNVPCTTEWDLVPLKHRMFFKDRCPNTYEPMLSPLYRLRKIKGEELTEEDDNLVELSKIIGGSEGKAKKIFEDWKSSELVGWKNVKELFLKV